MSGVFALAFDQKETQVVKDISSHELLARILELQSPAYGLVKSSPHMPISKIHREALTALEAEARRRNLKI
jgi:hypothetical protein